MEVCIKIIIIKKNPTHHVPLGPRVNVPPQPVAAPTQGLSGLQEHPKSSELRTGMAILPILHNIYHDLLSKLSGDASSPHRGSELQKQATKLESNRMKWCGDAPIGGTVDQ